MTSVCVTRVPRGHYRFWHVARMEWIKFRTLRSTWWTMGIGVAAAVAIGVAVGRGTKNASGDLTNNALAGMVPGLLLAGVLGVLVMTSEYSSGTIRATLAAVPGRPLLLAAKAAVFGAVALAAGEVAAFVSFLTVQAADAAKGLVLALDVLRTAIGGDGRSWAVPSAAATVAPVGAAAPAPLARPNLVWRKPLLHRAAILAGAASL
jgi:hypothetical protein